MIPQSRGYRLRATDEKHSCLSRHVLVYVLSILSDLLVPQTLLCYYDSLDINLCWYKQAKRSTEHWLSTVVAFGRSRSYDLAGSTLIRSVLLLLLILIFLDSHRKEWWVRKRGLTHHKVGARLQKSCSLQLKLISRKCLLTKKCIITLEQVLDSLSIDMLMARGRAWYYALTSSLPLNFHS